MDTYCEAKVELNWFASFDDHDNTMWEANSLFHNDGDPIRFRLKQALRDNNIWWVDASDGEIRTDEEWPSLEEAKADMQKANQNIAEECLG